jgi:hypothetical protein
VPALRERADYVTHHPASAGAVEFIEEHILTDATLLIPALRRHYLELGQTAHGEPVTIPAHGAKLLVVGPSETGKSTLTGVLVERLVASNRAFCLLDPEGDHQGLGELEGVVVLGGQPGPTLPGADELRQLLRQPSARLVLNLSALTIPEKVTYATQALGVVAATRSSSGLPHWLIVDEAHHIAPAEGSSAVDLLRGAGESLALTTLSATLLAPEVRRLANLVASTDLRAFKEALDRVPKVGGTALERGEALLAAVNDTKPQARRFQVARRGVQHRRHLRKYAEGELPPDRSFYFRGPRGAMNLRAANLKRFCELAEGVDEATWAHHLARGDYSAWMREMIKDGELADEVAALENGAPDARRRVLEAVRRRYAV